MSRPRIPLADRVRTRIQYAQQAGVRLRSRPRSVRARLAALEAAEQENRQLNRRIAELTDVVAELLLPVADRDETAVRERLAAYRADL